MATGNLQAILAAGGSLAEMLGAKEAEEQFRSLEKSLRGIETVTRGIKAGFDQTFGAFPKLLQGVTSAVANAASQFQGLGSSIRGFVEAASPGTVLLFDQSVRNLSGAIGSLLAPVLDQVRSLFQGVANWVTSLSPATKALITAMVGFAVVMGGVIAVVIALAAAMTYLDATMAGIPLLIGALVGALAGGAYLFSQTAFGAAFFSGAMDRMRQVIDAVMTVLEGFWEIIKSLALALIDAFGFNAQKGMGEFAKLLEKIMDVTLQLILVVGELARQMAKGGLDVEKAWKAAGLQLQLLKQKKDAVFAGSAAWKGLEEMAKGIQAAAMAGQVKPPQGGPETEEEKRLKRELEEARKVKEGQLFADLEKTVTNAINKATIRIGEYMASALDLMNDLKPPKREPGRG